MRVAVPMKVREPAQVPAVLAPWYVTFATVLLGKASIAILPKLKTEKVPDTGTSARL